MFVTTTVRIAFLCAAVHHVAATSCCCTPPKFNLPAILEDAINATVLTSSLQLDDGLLALRKKQALTIPSLTEMNVAIGQGGPIKALQTIDKFLYKRFLIEFAALFVALSGDVLKRFRVIAKNAEDTMRAEKVQAGKIKCAQNQIEIVITGIPGTIKLLGDTTGELLWAHYRKVVKDVRDLHAAQGTTREVYLTELDKFLSYGETRFNRILNASAYQFERYLVDIAQEIRCIVSEALKKQCHRGGLLGLLLK